MKNNNIRLKIGENRVIPFQMKQAREGWEEAAELAHKLGDDELLMPDSIKNDFDKEEWQWQCSQSLEPSPLGVLKCLTISRISKAFLSPRPKKRS